MSTPRINLDKALYTATASATAGREGRIASDDGTLDLPVSMPRALGGNGAPGTNPEQLFAAGYAACFGSAYSLVARMQKIKTGPVTITANVTIGTAGSGFGLAVELVASAPELPREQAEALMHAAHEVCPYSNATRGNIAVSLRLA
ncbi:organic hydroperoxide resistance protein [Sandaracinus amylolyticus]|uniref:Organic hydroperoxide resistance protein n=1 Tax=Sandaracinus amylolyticus TaxID=927083 RepID=A0A0F6W0D3_9BACT|nr:organic hydroperoxide resistance protein [Sandaracinus amylolyticus]AKF04198.1 Organic hydroperoxide resistance protein [Sandaracinus amylolyticus]